MLVKCAYLSLSNTVGAEVRTRNMGGVPIEETIKEN